jgi:hypothetical protein
VKIGVNYKKDASLSPSKPRQLFTQLLTTKRRKREKTFSLYKKKFYSLRMHKQSCSNRLRS